MTGNYGHVVYNEKPDPKGRLKKEMAVYDLLEKLGIPYWRLDHDAAMTMEACEGIDQILDICYCKNLFLRNTQKTEFYLLLIGHDKKFKTAVLSKQIGTARLSFAEPEYMEKYLNITPGAVSIMGLMNDTERKVHLLIDEDALNGEYMGCHPCVNTASLKIKTEDIYNKFLKYTGHQPVFVQL
ncbi:MAG: prolyl-tRNA synthetase associated domain-containing protein [Clostridiales bacterium]|nr:prolyl-tRNA synthetase associated domain-containing protein [Clostridiales bacterium]MDY3747425.1 prolyl-tRNA synthetase associated domain-containing protein [Lachnospiraceae bacterium]